MSKAAPTNFRLTAILYHPRSGSTLLRNELLKPPQVTALSSPGVGLWIERNAELLTAPNHAAFASAHDVLSAQWRELGLDRHDLKRHFARPAFAPQMPGLRPHLLLKFALFRFHAWAPQLFRHFDVIHLLRDPLRIVESLCRALAWNDGQAFFAGARKPQLPERADWLCAFAAAHAVAVHPTSGAEITTLPYHLACATFVSDFVHVHQALIERQAAAGDVCRRQITVKFEDFVAARDEWLARLATFMDVAPFSYPPNDVFFEDREEEGGIRMSQPTSPARHSHATSQDEVALATLTAPERHDVITLLAPARHRQGYL
ncbi:MAG TPA: hypothetical protein VGG33_18010 [Polyangia bacterium]